MDGAQGIDAQRFDEAGTFTHSAPRRAGSRSASARVAPAHSTPERGCRPHTPPRILARLWTDEAADGLSRRCPELSARNRSFPHLVSLLCGLVLASIVASPVLPFSTSAALPGDTCADLSVAGPAAHGRRADQAPPCTTSRPVRERPAKSQHHRGPLSRSCGRRPTHQDARGDRLSGRQAGSTSGSGSGRHRDARRHRAVPPRHPLRCRHRTGRTPAHQAARAQLCPALLQRRDHCRA